MPEAYSEAIEQTGIEPIDRPDVDIDNMAKGQALTFKAKVQVKPEVQLGAYSGIEVEAVEAAVSEEDITQELERLQQRHAELTVVEEGNAESGDMTVIDFEGFVDGVAFEGGKGENHSLELGSNSFIPGFEDQVIGMAIGDEKDIQVTFPEEYHSEDLKGKEATFKVKLHEIKRKSLPELDDEFALDVSEFDTLDEFKQDIQKRLTEQKEQQAAREKENALIEKASEAAEVEIPEVMIDTEVDYMVKEFANRIQMQGMNIEQYYQFSGQDEAALRAQMQEDAAKRVRNNLVLEAIAKAENIEATEEDLTAELEKMAEMYERSVEEIRSIFEAQGNLGSIKNDLVVRKTIEFLVSNSKSA